jgi:hypothetical protein
MFYLVLITSIPGLNAINLEFTGSRFSTASTIPTTAVATQAPGCYANGTLKKVLYSVYIF